jgi:hypothetical protein
MSEAFNDLPWHDAVILGFEIDRRRPGEVDEIVMSVVWPNERRSRIRFVECYALDAKMNFGVVATETVRSAVELDDTEALRVLREKWARLGADISGLKCFSIEMNSTASTLNVYARGWVREFEN